MFSKIVFPNVSHVCLDKIFPLPFIEPKIKCVDNFRLHLKNVTFLDVHRKKFPLICSSLNMPTSRISASSCVPRFHLNTSVRFNFEAPEFGNSSLSGLGTKWT